MRAFPLLPVFLLAVFVAGCASLSRRLEVSAVRKIAPGVTTTAQVEEMFGKPNEVITGSNGKSVARYFFRELRVNNDVRAYERREHPGDVLFRTLSLRYGAEGVIEQKLHDESVTPIYRYNQSYVAGPTLKPENLLFLRKDSTAAAELIYKLGEPTFWTLDTDGTHTLVWISAQARPDQMANAEFRRLVVLLNSSDVVRDYAIVMDDMPGVSVSWR
jgi:hypothetical protein